MVVSWWIAAFLHCALIHIAMTFKRRRQVQNASVVGAEGKFLMTLLLESYYIKEVRITQSRPIRDDGAKCRCRVWILDQGYNG